MQARFDGPGRSARRARSPRSRRLAVGVLLTLGGILASGDSAFGHATFRQPTAAVPPASEQAIGMHVPVERTEAHNSKIIVQVPAGFEVAAPCPEKVDWRCTITPSSSTRKETLVTWERTRGSDDPDEMFPFSVRTPAEPGSYPFKVNQIYSSDENVAWHGEPGSDYPAPVLEVR